MSLTLDPKPRTVETHPKLTEAYYTICPVFTASNVAVELGWLDEEFKKVSAKATYLRSLANSAGWIPHYTHSLANLFRDGGSIPTIESKADRTDTKLIGLTWAQAGGQILVRSRSGIHRVADLKGRKIGLYHSLNKNKIDFHRATAHRGILLALELAGLNSKDVELIDIDNADDPQFASSQKPAELWAQSRAHRSNPHEESEVLALKGGCVDAIYANPGKADSLVRTGEFAIIEDLASYPDWTLQVANGPYTNAVSAELAEKHPEVVIAFLRASIRAGRWINEHRAAAAEIFKRVTFYSNVKLIERQIAEVDFVPQLSPLHLAAIDIQKKFLRDHGYVKNDFDVNEWADSSYLEEALRSI